MLTSIHVLQANTMLSMYTLPLFLLQMVDSLQLLFDMILEFYYIAVRQYNGVIDVVILNAVSQCSLISI